MVIDWANIDWAIVVSTFVGPIAAVMITLWYQENSLRKRSRHELFVSMMRNRRHPTSQEFVGALNLVPVHFYADKDVMKRYAELIAVFDDTSWFIPEALNRLNEQAELRIAYLLSAMSRAVGRPVEQLQILRGAYAPQGWKDEEQAQKEIRSALSDVLTGKRLLPILVPQLLSSKDQAPPTPGKLPPVSEDPSSESPDQG
tara:strand:- start:4729 stop:5328 length:600 start_codon:yes stop_codon:yes gene_type:complete